MRAGNANLKMALRSRGSYSDSAPNLTAHCFLSEGEPGVVRLMDEL